jgi:VWFA-related protein
MRHLLRTMLTALALGLLGSVLSVSADPAGQAHTTQAPEAPPTFQGGVAIVQVDVIVRDHKGAFVGDLAKSDFRVFDDGKAEAVETFALVGTPGAVPGAGTGSAAEARAGVPTLTPAARPMFVLVFDDEHMEPGSFKNVQRAAKEFVSREFTGNAVGGIVSSKGMAGNRLTSDPETLLEAIGKLKPSGHLLFQTYDLRQWPRLLSLEEAGQIANGNAEVLDAAVLRAGQEAAANSGQGQDLTAAVRQKALEITAEARPATDQLLYTLARLMDGLSKFQGPKSVIFFSDGFYSDQSWAPVQQVIGLAARAHVRIYSVDARGLNFGNADMTAATPNIQGDELAQMLSDSDTENDGPNSLAVDTGGFVIRHTNEFAAGLNQIAADATTYYLIGYRPPENTFDGKFHKISVEVDRPGVVVRARRGYLAVRPPPNVITTQPQAPSAPAGAAVPEAPAIPGASAVPFAPAGTGSTVNAPAAVPEPAVPPAPSGAHLRPDGLQHVSLLQQLQPGAGQSETATNALRLYANGDLSGAAAGLASAQKGRLSDGWVGYAYGLAEYGLTRYAAATKAWELVRKASPMFEPVYFDLADGYARSGNLQSALKVLREAQHRWSKDPEVYNAIGFIQVRLGVVDEAVKSFEQATTVAPKAELGWFNLAKLHELLYLRSRHYEAPAHRWDSNEKERDQAVEAFNQCVKVGGSLKAEAQKELARLQSPKEQGGSR